MISNEMMPELKLYAVRNSKGQYFRPKGMHGHRSQWVDDINKAKIYTKISQARACITAFALKGSKEFSTPELIELTVASYRVIDETERVEDAKNRKDASRAKARALQAEKETRLAQEKLEAAKAELAELASKKYDNELTLEKHRQNTLKNMKEQQALATSLRKAVKDGS